MSDNNSAKAFVTGTFDTKATELNYITDCLVQAGIEVVRVDIGTSSGSFSSPGQCEVSAHEVASHRPQSALEALAEPHCWHRHFDRCRLAYRR